MWHHILTLVCVMIFTTLSCLTPHLNFSSQMITTSGRLQATPNFLCHGWDLRRWVHFLSVTLYLKDFLLMLLSSIGWLFIEYTVNIEFVQITFWLTNQRNWSCFHLDSSRYNEPGINTHKGTEVLTTRLTDDQLRSNVCIICAKIKTKLTDCISSNLLYFIIFTVNKRCWLNQVNQLRC